MARSLFCGFSFVVRMTLVSQNCFRSLIYQLSMNANRSSMRKHQACASPPDRRILSGMGKPEHNKRICRECGWRGLRGEVLEAPNPFDREYLIYGCPKCREVQTTATVCDEPGCWNEDDAGFPTPAGYRRTCSKHIPAEFFNPACDHSQHVHAILAQSSNADSVSVPG